MSLWNPRLGSCHHASYSLKAPKTTAVSEAKDFIKNKIKLFISASVAQSLWSRWTQILFVITSRLNHCGVKNNTSII